MLLSIHTINEVLELAAKIVVLISGASGCAWLLVRLVLNNMYHTKTAAEEDRKRVEDKHKEFDERLQLQRQDLVKLQNGIELFQHKHLHDMEVIKIQMEHNNALMKDQSAMIKDIVHSVNSIRSWKIQDVVKMEVENVLNNHQTH